jgi:hypothetical protein
VLGGREEDDAARLPTANAVWAFREKKRRSTATTSGAVELDQVVDERVDVRSRSASGASGLVREAAVVHGAEPLPIRSTIP